MSNYITPVSLKTKILNLFRGIFKIPFFEEWLFVRVNGKPPEDFFAKLIPPNYTYEKNHIKNVIRDGIKYSLDLSDYLEHFIFWGIKDSGREILYDKIKPGMVVLDIGANIGDTLLHFSKLVGDSGKIFACEPDTTNFKKLQENINCNECTNVNIYNLGLGSAPATLKMYTVNPGNKGMNRMFLDKSVEGDFTEVKVEVLDEVVRKLNLSEIDFIKIDVEGFEFEVLKGAKEILNKHKPALFIELDDANLKSNHASSKTLLNFLKEKGYQVKIAQTGMPLNDLDFNFENTHFDIFCEA